MSKAVVYSRTDLQQRQETLLENMKGLRKQLVDIIEIQCGLLDILHSMGVLTYRQIEDITCKPTPGSQVRHLLELSEIQSKRFLVALEMNQQTHVVNFIRDNGVEQQRSGTVDWPLRMSKIYPDIERNWSKLIELLDCRNGLLDEMLSTDCINYDQKEYVESGDRDAKRNEYLLKILTRKSTSHFGQFIACLLETKQPQVVSLLVPDAAGNVCPLREERKRKLQENRATLIELMDSRHGLLSQLYSADCITTRQKEFVETAASPSDTNGRLLDILRRGSESYFDTFLDGLRRTGQSHVCNILTGSGSVARLVGNIGGSDHMKQDEARIVEQFMKLMEKSSDEQLSQLRTRVNQKADELLAGGDVRLAALDTRGSIRLFFVCKSLTDVHYLYELYSSTELKTFLEELFTLLLDNGRAANLDSLEWEMSDYTNCIRNICASANMQLFVQIYGMALENRDREAVNKSYSSLLGFELLPSELVEMLLIKTTGQLFVKLHLLTAGSEAVVLATLCAVSLIWWRTLTYRLFNRRLLKHHFNQVCHPFLSNPRCTHSAILHEDCAHNNISGVAEWNGELYVACTGSDKLQVFTGRPPFSHLREVTVNGLTDASDIVVCSATKRLFVADNALSVIWRVNLLSDKQADKFVTTPWPPLSMSIKSRRLLVTAYDNDALLLYADDDDDDVDAGDMRPKSIPLPDYMRALHAVESSRGTYIVSHSNRFPGDTMSQHDSVTEVDVDGNVVRQFVGHSNVFPERLNKPFYLLLADDSSHVIVADLLNERVVILNPDLRLKRVLVQPLTGQPIRMCIGKESGLLFVAFNCSADIGAFKVRRKTATTKSVV